MTVEGWKARASLEYAELDYRIKALENIIEYHDFEPNCPEGLLRDQLAAMRAYRDVLEERAEIEGIRLVGVC